MAGVDVAHDHQHRVVGPHPGPVPGRELVAPGCPGRRDRADDRERPGVALAEHGAVQHRPADLRRVRLELGEIAEAERPDALEVRLPERRPQDAVAEDVQHRGERGGGEGDGSDHRILVRLAPEEGCLVLECRGDGERIAEGGALVEHVAHEARGSGLAGGVRVLAGPDDQLHGGQRKLVLLDDPHRQAVLQRVHRGHRRLEDHRRPRLGERRAEGRVRRPGLGDAGIGAGGSGGRRRAGSGGARGGAGEEGGGGEQREAAETFHGGHPPHWAEAVRAAGLTVSTTRPSGAKYRRALSWTWAGVTAR